MLTFPVPAALHGEALTRELGTAGLPVDALYVREDELVIDGPTNRAAVQQVIDAHVPPTPPADPDTDLAGRIRAVHDDPQVSASVKKLAAALLGLNGESAVAGRPTDTGR